MTKESSAPLSPMRQLGSAPHNRWRVSDTTVNLVREAVPAYAVSLPATPQHLTLDVNRSALVVIDMQNDFCHADGWLGSIGVDVTPARAPIAPLQALLPTWREAGGRVVWLNWGNRPDQLNLSPSLLHVYQPTGQGVGLGTPLPGTGASVLEKGSWSAQVVRELAIAPGDIQIDKYRMSGFWDTPLDSVLRNLGVTTLLFAGVNADQCVMCTLQDANFSGYDCVLLQDCTATTSPPFCMDATLYNVHQCFGFVAQSADLISGLE